MSDILVNKTMSPVNIPLDKNSREEDHQENYDRGATVQAA